MNPSPPRTRLPWQASLLLLTGACTAPGGGVAPAAEGGDEGGAVDSDGDGLSDAAEELVGTRADSPDTDGDGLNDLDELGGRSPEDAPDCDDDGKPDAIEASNADTDGDGVPDDADAADSPFCTEGIQPRITGDPEARCRAYVCPEGPAGEAGDDGGDAAIPSGEGEGERPAGGEGGEGGEGEGEVPGCAKLSDADLTCDGVDDDCDGQIDDDFVVVECGVGACLGHTECVDGVSGCSGAEAGEIDDACDGIDDDCDGQVDEGYVPDASCGQGACADAATASSCVDGIEAPCAPGPQVAEDDGSCDGVDDDCDGLVDEDFLQIRCGVGVCAAIRSCNDGRVNCPAGEPLSADDATCDGVDDNCNAEPDEDYLPVPCGLGVCAVQTTCDDGQVECPELDPQGPDTECDGVDQDCDGDADEGYLGEECGIGACGTLTVCEGGQVVCPDVAHGEVDDDCDGIDDDCDGVADEDYVGEACGDGVCASVSICSLGQVVCPEGEPEGDDDDCDGVDDNCNGVADENYVGEACGVGACATRTVCVGAQVVCPEVQHAPTDISCDGVDDDCDGDVDDEYRGQPCGVGACSTDTVCEDGQVVCPELEAAPDDPICDSIDDDCDGTDDEDFAGLPCGVGACATDTVCVRGRVRCPAVEHPNRDTSCNGIDDDCDSIVDDEFQPLDCSVGECQAATSCAAGDDGGAPSVVCDLGEHDAADTVCDGLDEDCDGEVDEDFVEVACGRPGVCAGVLRCVDGGTQCQDQGEELGPDTNCDGVDDDCDGTADDGYEGDACQAQAEGRVCNGTFQCVVGEVACIPDGGDADDTCDQVDDDCDGELDEDYPADACLIGSCDGVAVCDAGQIFCEQVVKDDDLTCDNCDDDNNGDVDDGFVAGAGCELANTTCGGQIICANGRELCERIVGEDDPTCDSCDDDQDDETDEDYVGAACQQDDGCGGLTVCSFGEPVCGALDPNGGDATCDGCDDDGDGTDDEDWDSGANCTIDGCPGTTECSGGAIVCAQGRAGLQDNDCDVCDEDGDGQLNEHYSSPDECVAGDGCQGHWECQAVQEVCVSGGLADDDTCDGCDDDGDGIDDENFLGGDACVTDANCSGEESCVEGSVVCIDNPNPPELDDDGDGVDDDCDGEVDEDAIVGDRLGWITFTGTISGTGCHYQAYDGNGWPRDTNGDGWADCVNCTTFATCNDGHPRAEIFAFDEMDNANMFGLETSGMTSLDGIDANELTLSLDGLSLVDNSHCSFTDARGSRQFGAEWAGGTGAVERDGDPLVVLSNVTMAWFFENPTDCFIFGNNNECIAVGNESAGKSLGLLTADVTPADGAPLNLARDLGPRIVMQIGRINPPGPYASCTEGQGGANQPCRGFGSQLPCVDGCAYSHTIELRMLATDHGEDLPAAGLELAPYGNRSNQGIQVMGSNGDLSSYEGEDMWKLQQGGWFSMPAAIPADSAKLRFRYGLLYDEDRSDSCFQECWRGNCARNCGQCSNNPLDHPVVDDFDNSQVRVTFNSCDNDNVVETHNIKWCAHNFSNSVRGCVDQRNLSQQCVNDNFGCAPQCGNTSWHINYTQCMASQADNAGSDELHLADQGPGGGCTMGNEVAIDGMNGRAGYFLFQFQNGDDNYENMMVDDLQIVSE